MRSRIADLQSQMEKLNKLVELKDAQIASLIARLAEQDRAGKPAGASVKAAPPAAPGAAAAPAQGESIVDAQASESTPRP